MRGNSLTQTDRSIDAWTERLRGVGAGMSWLAIASLLYGAIRLVVWFF